MKSGSHWATDDSMLQNLKYSSEDLIYPMFGLQGTWQEGPESSSEIIQACW